MSPRATTDDTAEVRIPRVMVAMAHPTMRRYVCDVIEQDCRCWIATTPPDPALLSLLVARLQPDVVVLEATRFPDCWPELPDAFPGGQLVVVGPFPDDAYRDVALAAGAGAWIPRDRLANELGSALCRVATQAGCACGCESRTTAPTDDASSCGDET